LKGVTVRNLVKRFGSVVAANGVSFSVEPGEAMALLGPSGCGKTTVLRCIAGLETPDQGEISIGDRLVFSKDKGVNVPPNKRNIGMVFQSYALWPHMTVYRNIAYPLEVRGWSRGDIDRRVRELLEMLGLKGLEDRYPHQLSGGQQQRVALARAIAPPVDLLLLDEPLSNVDAKLREVLRIELRNLQRKLRITMIYVTHDRLEAMTIADKIGIMSSGTLIAIGTPSEVIANPGSPFAAEFLGHTRILEGVVVEEGPIASIAADSGVKVRCRNPQNARAGDRVVVYAASVKLDKHQPQGNILKVYIRDAINLGTLIEYQAESPDGNTIVVRLPLSDDIVIERNGYAYLSFTPDGCYALKTAQHVRT